MVLSGAKEAIARVEEALAATGITAKRLTVATAFHSPLVARVERAVPRVPARRCDRRARRTIDVYG